MMRYFRLAMGALAMLFTMMLAAALTLRIALHGGEVPVPNFAGLTVSEASDAALHAHLDLNIENKYYSTTVPAGRILSQAPAAGSQVRKDWQVRVTVSLGPQQVTIPDTVGMPIREATMALRRDQLDLGTVGHLDAPGQPDMVLAQTPPPNAGVDQPRVNLLLSSAADGASTAFVMPSFVGMSYATANHIAVGLGLRVASIGGIPAAPVTDLTDTTVRPDGVRVDASGNPVLIPAAPTTPVGPVLSQTPEAGHRGSRGDVVRLNFSHASSSGSSASGGSSPTPQPAPHPAPAMPHTTAPAGPAAKPLGTKPSVPAATAPSAPRPTPGNSASPATTLPAPRRSAPDEALPEAQPAPPHRNAFQKLFGLGKHKDSATPVPQEQPQP